MSTDKISTHSTHLLDYCFEEFMKIVVSIFPIFITVGILPNVLYVSPFFEY